MDSLRIKHDLNITYLSLILRCTPGRKKLRASYDFDIKISPISLSLVPSLSLLSNIIGFASLPLLLAPFLLLVYCESIGGIQLEAGIIFPLL